jgi:hypothetical protein
LCELLRRPFKCFLNQIISITIIKDVMKSLKGAFRSLLLFILILQG